MPKLTQKPPEFSMNEVRSALLAVLNLVPSVKIGEIQEEVRLPQGREVDLLVKVSNGEKNYQMVFEAKRSGEPRFVREAVYYIQSIASQSGENIVPVFVAPYLSAASQKLCMDLGVSFLDLSGNCRIAFDTVFIQQLGFTNSWAERRPLKSLFAIKASRAIRCMLVDPRKRWQVQELAANAEISLALVSKVKQKLMALEYAREESDGFFIVQPELVLKDWAKMYSLEKSQQIECYMRGSIAALEKSLDVLCKQKAWKYCLAGFSVSEKVAPHVRGITHGYAYVDDPSAVAASLGWQDVGYKGNFRLIKPADEAVFWNLQDVDGLMLASDVQTYLDLSSMGGRAEEAADILLERRLRPAW